MEFTYDAYKALIELLREEEYEITNYHCYSECKGKCVILRHDIDNSITKAFQLASKENALNVSSTYFVLLSSGFYNTAEKEVTKSLREMYRMGHEIGLHFDEVKYACKTVDEIVCCAEKERGILESILDVPISTVSMHRPSKLTLDSDISFPSMINSYGKEFFREFKYVSDSRMFWRENVNEIIKTKEYKRLHILTHAFWYAEKPESAREKLLNFFASAGRERYDYMDDNIRDLQEFVMREEVGE